MILILSSVRGQPADHPNKLPHTVHHSRGEPHTDKKKVKFFLVYKEMKRDRVQSHIRLMASSYIIWGNICAFPHICMTLHPIRGPPQSVAICSLAVAICSGRGYLCLAVAICSFRKKIFKKLILELILMFKIAFLPSNT